MTNQADLRANHAGLADYLQTFSMEHNGNFQATLVKENGQGYNLVIKAPNGQTKRIALVSRIDDPKCVVGSSWEVRDIIEKLFAKRGVLSKRGAFPKQIEAVVDRSLQSLPGCVHLEIKKGVVVSATFQDGVIRP